MAIFNPQFFTNPAGSLNTAFGIPTCITNLTTAALSYLSPGLLTDLADAVESGRKTARSAIAKEVDNMFGEFGILQYDDATGKLNLFSESSRHGIDLGFLDSLANITGQFAEFEDLIAQGEAIIEGLEECMGQFNSWLDSQGPSPVVGAGGIGGGGTTAYTDNFRSSQLAISQARIQNCFNFIDDCNKTLGSIGEVLTLRQNEEDEAAATSDPVIFRLVYGPPVSKQGVFILSEDGLYYDSQNRDYNGNDIPSASDIGVVADSDAWNLNRPPNLGGRGTMVTLEDINQYVDTLFDINKIDETITDYYDNDHFLQVISAQKQKMLFDTSAQVDELVASGYTPDSALVVNHRQSMYAFLDSFNTMLNKRKKQIEVAVKAPTYFGSKQSFGPGEVPINDFSYLSGTNLNVSMEQQERLVFEAASIDEVVLPIKPLFVKSTGSQSQKLNLPFSVPEIGKGSIILGGSVSSTGVPTLSITDSVVSDRLFAVYNFLKPVGVDPGSKQYGSLNCATLGIKQNSQLIGRNQDMFTSGLGTPLFNGLVHRTTGTSPVINNYGSICRLPDIEGFQNFMYGLDGASFDCWLHLPNFGASSNHYERGEATVLDTNPVDGGWGNYNYYKILLANENVGGQSDYTASNVVNFNGINNAKGMLMGFTRDPIITEPFGSQGRILPGSNTDPGMNAGIAVENTVSANAFFIAPTIGLNSKEATFIPRKTDCIGDSYCKLSIDTSTTVNGVKFTDVSGAYMHLSVSFDTSANECRVYLDSVLMATSGMDAVFGVEPNKPARLPSFLGLNSKETSSFSYNQDSTDKPKDPAMDFFADGPALGENFTPWMLGGGWTDGMPVTTTTLDGGFMGNKHGLSSGLGGHVGSVKFYSKPLSTSEVLTNYNAQKGFFKNILT
tara:strand:+ start:13903 stop:16590 length:2688 start_codon:yes stop_codon:yes gene_type:complete